MKKSLQFFQDKKIRSHWDEEKEAWFFSVTDEVGVLTDSSAPKRYWSDLKRVLKKEGSQVYENIVHLKMIASDGKNYKPDCFSTEDLFRLIQSIPSKKVEPFSCGWQRWDTNE